MFYYYLDRNAFVLQLQQSFKLHLYGFFMCKISSHEHNALKKVYTNNKFQEKFTEVNMDS